ncbi:hypothetical protein SKAU_G00123120 [Synaphobranchus kaupii]|uniref:Ig-like domain-containing protein n=1 Tax=Synaphobranchus kaupii TaxID=118154 RepID=A0A9Q1FPG5_SYNKA|nr:hypothetical protein SKAU_G00123120 [Synaphobranchus kaupii]
MASFIWFLSVVFYAKLMCAESTDKLVSLDCQGEIHGVYGEDSLLKCSVKSSGDPVKIIMVSWWRTGEDTPLFVVSNGEIVQQKDQRFSLAHPGSSIDVSFLVKNTKRTDEGKYQCQVITDSGEDQSVISLYVIATYSQPDMSSVPEKDIVEDTEITLFCNASGGYPVGMVHWYGVFGTNWTRSAVTTVEKTTDKRVNLSSKYTLRASSSFPTYRCSVLNSKGVEEGKAELHLPFREQSVKATDPEKGALNVIRMQRIQT